MASIPVIDVSGLINGHQKEVVVENIKQAIQNIGFFYISNHGISNEEMDKYLLLAKLFFHLPPEQKRKSVKSSEHNSVGYVEIGVENLDDNQVLNDHKEAMDLCVHQNGFHLNNKWPDASVLPHWKEDVQDFMEKIENLGSYLIKAFALAMGKDEDYFTKWYIKPNNLSMIRFLRYPPTPSDAIGCGAHSDYGTVTLLLQDSIGGLQIQHKDQWIDATPIPGTLVINVGDCMEFLTNGAFKATKHRVINKSSDQERFVCLIFYDPTLDMTVDCVEEFKERPESFSWPRPKTYGEHLLRRYGETYSYQ